MKGGSMHACSDWNHHRLIVQKLKGASLEGFSSFKSQPSYSYGAKLRDSELGEQTRA